MSDAQDDRPSKLSGVAELPWSVALVLFLVLLGVLAALGMGLTSDPVAEPEMAESSQAEEPPQPASEDPDDASTGTGEADEIVSETASGASSEPGMSADPEAARGGGTEPQPDSTSPDQDMAEQMSPEPDPAQAEALDEAVPTGAPDLGICTGHAVIRCRNGGGLDPAATARDRTVCRNSTAGSAAPQHRCTATGT